MDGFVHDAVRAYLSGLARPDDEVSADVRRRSEADGVPAASADTAALLRVLAAAMAARRVFEIGTGYGYSALVLASGMDEQGQIFTMEFRQARADIAREHIAQAGLSDRINVMIGDARRLVHKVAGPFDLILSDASKELLEPLHDRTVALLRPGGILVTDNILWGGDVIAGFNQEPAHDEASIADVAKHNRRLAADDRLDTVFLPLGDGVAVSVRKKTEDRRQETEDRESA